MTVEQPREDLTRQDIDNTIKIIRILNLMLDSQTITPETKKKIAQFIKEGFRNE